MPTFRYRALESTFGEIISGSIAAPTAAEVGKRIEYLGLFPINSVTEDNKALIKRGDAFVLFSRPRPEDVTIFTGDLALLLRTGARIQRGAGVAGRRFRYWPNAVDGGENDVGNSCRGELR